MTTDHDRTTCGHPWCRAHQSCSCPFASTTPHLAVGCRYATDDDQDRRRVTRGEGGL